MDQVILYAYAVAVGTVAGGIVVSAHRLVTERPPSFQDRPESAGAALWQVVVLVFGGPLVLMRNALRGRIVEGRPLPFVAASAVIASLWCFLSGVFLIGMLAGS